MPSLLPPPLASQLSALPMLAVLLWRPPSLTQREQVREENAIKGDIIKRQLAAVARNQASIPARPCRSCAPTVPRHAAPIYNSSQSGMACCLIIIISSSNTTTTTTSISLSSSSCHAAMRKRLWSRDEAQGG